MPPAASTGPCRPRRLAPRPAGPWALCVQEADPSSTGGSSSGQHLLDPADHTCDAGVDAKVVGPAAAQAPADQSRQEPAAAGLPAHQRAPRVALKGGEEGRGRAVSGLGRPSLQERAPDCWASLSNGGKALPCLLTPRLPSSLGLSPSVIRPPWKWGVCLPPPSASSCRLLRAL